MDHPEQVAVAVVVGAEAVVADPVTIAAVADRATAVGAVGPGVTAPKNGKIQASKNA